MKQEQFEFNGDWEFLYKLEELSKTFSFNGFGYDPKIREKINIRFLDKRDLEADPTFEQLNSLKFIIDNQKEIIEAIYNHITEIVFPLHKTFIDDEEIFFPKISTSEDLSKVLGLDEIIIQLESKENFAYTTITLHKLRYIACGEDWDYRPIYSDLGLEYEKKSQNDTNKYIEFHSKPLVYQTPLPKYNKLKPWQKNINRLYPIRLIQNKNNNKFFDYIDNLYIPDEEFPNLDYFSYWAKQSDNNEIEEYIKQKVRK
jgi:hypothetical protein